METMKFNFRPAIRLTLTALAIFLAMSIYETLKQFLHPDATIWRSHLVTIFFSTLIGTLAVHFVSNKYRLLCRRLDEERVERKRVMEELRGSEAKYRNLLDNIPQKIFYKDRNSVYLAVNPSYSKDFGMLPDGFVGKTDYDFYPEKLAEKYRTDDRRIMSSGAAEEMDEDYIMSCDTCSVHTVKKPVYDDNGAVMGILGIFWDITERKRVEQEIKRSEARLKILFESAPDPFYLLDLNGRIVDANRAACDLGGYAKKEDAIGKTLAELRPLPPEDRQRAAELLAQAALGHRCGPDEFIFNREDGAKIFLENIVRPIVIGGKALLLGIARDITRRKQAEEALQKSKTMLRTLFDGILEPLFMLDRDMRVCMLNQAAKGYYALAGYNDAIGKSCHELRGEDAPCEGCERPFSSLRGCEGSFERKCPFDAARVEKVVFYSTQAEPGLDQYSIVQVNDITSAKQMERELIQNQNLAALGLLASGVAHEISNPNNFIFFNIPILRDYLEVLMPIVDDYAEGHPGFQLFGMSYEEFRKDIFKLVEDMGHGSKRIDMIVSGMKDLEKERNRSERRPVGLRHAIERAAAICDAEIRKTVKSFQIDVPEDLPPIVANPETIEQILVKLLINAAQAADKEDSWIGARVLTEGMTPPGVVIEVSDNGCGMEEKTKEKIFDPFFTTRAAMMGTGLGLYVCRKLAKEMGAHIEVESKPGIGSTFRVILGNSG